jgi:hypothetical protein
MYALSGDTTARADRAPGQAPPLGPPDHLSSCPLGVSRDEIESVG